MKRDRLFNYNEISLADIEENKHLVFVCDGDNQRVLVERG